MANTYVLKDMKCWICGGKATRKRDLTNPKKMFGQYAYSIPVEDDSQRCYCEECYDNLMKEIREENKLYITLKKKRMFETAVDRMEHQKIRLYDYKEAIDTVYEYFMENLDRFDSSYEVMAAIVLIHNHVHIEPQAKVGGYQVDFLLKDDHVVVEIDGDRHKYNKRKDSERDEHIKRMLGAGWEIIRISTECLDMNAVRLVTAIEAVLDKRHKRL